MKTTLGYLAILLGVAGLILASGAAVVVWPVASAVNERTETAASQADEGLTRVREAISRVQGKVKATTKAVEKVRASAARVAEGKTKVDPDVTKKVDQLISAL